MDCEYRDLGHNISIEMSLKHVKTGTFRLHLQEIIIYFELYPQVPSRKIPEIGPLSSELTWQNQDYITLNNMT